MSALPAITTNNLRKEYDDVVALDSISITVQDGEFFGLLGPNGAGKTTFINVLLNLVEITEGHAEVFGHHVEHQRSEVHDYIGIAPQEVDIDVFFPIKRVLLHKAGYHGIPPSTARQRANSLLKELGIYDKRNTKIEYLSGGMKRRVLLARALITQPDLLILDEPTAGVDVELRRELWNTMRSYNDAGNTILLTTHYIKEAEKLCERVAMMQSGEIVAVDSPENFIGMGTDTIEVELKTDDPITLELSDVEYEVDGNVLYVYTQDAASHIPKVLDKLENDGRVVESVETRTSTLEDIFVRLTGDNDA